MALSVRTGGSRHTGLAAPPHKNNQFAYNEVVKETPADGGNKTADNASKGANVTSRTGDTSNIVLYIVIMTLAAAAIYVLFTRRRRSAR